MNRPIFTLLVFLLTCSPCYGFGLDSLSDIASGVQEVTTAISDTSKVLQQDKGHSKPAVAEKKIQPVEKKPAVKRQPKPVERKKVSRKAINAVCRKKFIKRKTAKFDCRRTIS
ncbi:hypothetical protein MKHDV_01792 [Halodesulfovibrio sp. MK-HDV]|nr:hypothetical protein MKHDV_01792 [Halodesulfovibrio sp. MK-HDV]